MNTRHYKLIVKFGLGCLLMFTMFTASAQGNTTKIAVLARPAQDSIALRWAPETAITWQLLNNNGYTIRRFTILRDGKLLDNPEQVLLTRQPVKPEPMAAWKPLVDADNQYATIAAQALYGSEFTVTQQQSGVGELISRVQENESRFSFALFSADQSFKVAQMLGLGYVDRTAKANEKYVYRIYPAVADQYMRVDTGVVYTGFADYSPLPKPYDVQADAQNKGVMVSWNQEVFTGIYTTYIVERSEDKGVTFVAVNDAPVVNTTADAAQEDRRANKLDTVSAINRRLVYRVKGISPFGEIGPASDTVSVAAYHRLKVTPTILRAEVIENKRVELDWEMPYTEAAITGFDVERTSNPEKGYNKINSKRIPGTSFSLTDFAPATGNYYRIRAYGKNENETTYSFPVFVQLIDSIPPAPPVLLAGQITKEGIVQLSWKDNTEPDLLGYRVYRANSLKEEFVQVTKKAVDTAAFTDTIQVESLARKIYYKVVAIDRRYNPSGFSSTLELKRPDVLPPAPPSFTSVVSETSGVHIRWNRSASEDVVKQELYRTEAGQENWTLLSQLPNTTQTYADASGDVKTTYTYKIRAIDEAQLFSDSKPFSGKKLDTGLKPAVMHMRGIADRENMQIAIRWDYNQVNVESYLLYREEPGEGMRLYKTLDASQREFIDSDLFINTIYQYRLKVLFADGSESGFSKAVQVNY